MIFLNNTAFRLLLATAFTVPWIIGCQSTQTVKKLPQIDQAGQVHAEPASEIVLSQGDVIEIKFPYASQFNETQTIRPNGKIELQLVGEVEASGKTLSELREELIKFHSSQLKHPDLAVVVHKFNERNVYVAGEVNKPGPIDIPGRLTALEAIMHAGGFNMDTAQVKNVVVIRQSDEGRQVYVLNFKDQLSGKLHDPFYLEPHDVIFVPRTTIANVNQWIEQHIYKILPSINAGYAL